MTGRHAVRNEGPEHASAARRLANARNEEVRLGGLSAAAAGTRTGPLAQRRLSEARAYVASRAQWLHWIEEGESLAPWADGEWGPQQVDTTAQPQVGQDRREQRCLTTRNTERRDRAGAVR
jgi:hypothetical protein